MSEIIDIEYILEANLKMKAKFIGKSEATLKAWSSDDKKHKSTKVRDAIIEKYTALKLASKQVEVGSENIVEEESFKSKKKRLLQEQEILSIEYTISLIQLYKDNNNLLIKEPKAMLDLLISLNKNRADLDRTVVNSMIKDKK